jgi:hypothetical protein
MTAEGAPLMAADNAHRAPPRRGPALRTPAVARLRTGRPRLRASGRRCRRNSRSAIHARCRAAPRGLQPSPKNPNDPRRMGRHCSAGARAETLIVLGSPSWPLATWARCPIVPLGPPRARLARTARTSTSTASPAASTSWSAAWRTWARPGSARSTRDLPGAGGSCGPRRQRGLRGTARPVRPAGGMTGAIRYLRGHRFP